MNTDVKQLWVETLRSARFVQGRNRLRIEESPW